MFPIYCRVWNFFEYIKDVLKTVTVTVCRTDVLHHCNRLCSVKFDKLKEFDYVRIEKKPTHFSNILSFFSNV